MPQSPVEHTPEAGPAGPPQRPLPALRGRLRRLAIGATLAAGALLAAAMWVAVAGETDELLDETLEASAEVLSTLVAAQRLPADGNAVLPGSRRQAYFAWQVLAADAAGLRVLLRSASAPGEPMLAAPTAGFADTPAWRVHATALPAEGAAARWLLVAQTRAERDEAQAEVALAAVLAALGASGLIAWLLHARVGGLVAPLDELSHRLRRHDPASGEPLGPPALAELAPIHDAIDELSERLRRRLANERAFSAHAAHALRTPLASIDAQLAVAQRDASPALAPRLERVRQGTARLSRVVGALLALFRSGSELRRERLLLAPLLQRLPLEGLAIEVEAGASVHADADLLTAALLNLADNALRHGATRWQVRVASDAAGTRLTLHDNGSGMPAEQRERLAQALAVRHYDQPGMGLGLMLADLVAHAHGGALALPAVAEGCAVALQLAAADSGITPHPPAGAGA